MVTPRSRLRLLALLPVLYALFGVWIIAATISLRQFWSPLPGYGAGAMLVLIAMITIGQLWLARARAPLWVAMSGLVTTVVVWLLGRLFPFVIATSDPPPLLWRAWYPIVVSLGVILTIVLPWIARATLRRAANER